MGGRWVLIVAWVVGSTFFAMPAGPAVALGVDDAPPVAFATVHAPMQVTGDPAMSEDFSVAEIPVTITTPGQRASFTFDGVADELVTVVLDGSTIRGCWTRVSILAPDMSQLDTTVTCRPTASLKHVRLPSDGTYTLMLTPAGASLGTARLVLYTLADTVGDITMDGLPITVELTAPGQRASYTFDATAGQVVTATLSGSTIKGCWTKLTIFKPDHSRLDSVSTCREGALLAHRTLPAAGTYTLTLEPAEVSTGRATLALYTVVDVEGAVPSTGTPVPVRSPRSPTTPR